jgi:hypothetical protein
MLQCMLRAACRFVVLLLACEADRGFDNEHTADAPPKISRKRPYKEMVGTGSSFVLRHRSWLQRDKGVTSWRPTQFFRVSAKKWAHAIDNQIRGSTIHKGLVRFLITPEMRKHLHWSLWPGLGIAADGGSDGVSGSFALLYFSLLNVWLW